VKSLHPRDSRLWKVVSRVHYRLVTNRAGYPLSRFKGSRELLKATFDGFTGKEFLHHWFTAYDVYFVALIDAYEKAETLHRDVSLGNIILCRLKEGMERFGYLIDWELSCKLGRATIRDHVLTVCLILDPKWKL
jgi:hypothetical protein